MDTPGQEAGTSWPPRLFGANSYSSDEEKVAEIQRMEKERLAREWEEGMFSPYQEQLLRLEFDRISSVGSPGLSKGDIEKLHQMNPLAVEQCAAGNVKMCALLTAATGQIRVGTPATPESANAYVALELDTNQELVDRLDGGAQMHAAQLEADRERFEETVSPGLQTLARRSKKWHAGVPPLGPSATTMTALRHRLTLFNVLRDEAAGIVLEGRKAHVKPLAFGRGTGLWEPLNMVDDGGSSNDAETAEMPSRRDARDIAGEMAQSLRRRYEGIAANGTDNGEAEIDALVDGCREISEIASYDNSIAPSLSLSSAAKGTALYEQGIGTVLGALRVYDQPWCVYSHPSL